MMKINSKGFEKILDTYLPRDDRYIILAVVITILATMFYLMDYIGAFALCFYLSYDILAAICYFAVKRRNRNF